MFDNQENNQKSESNPTYKGESSASEESGSVDVNGEIVDTEPIMSFEKIMHGTECSCLKDAEENPEILFIKKIDGPELREKDFITYWEKGKAAPSSDCHDICGFKGVSINKIASAQDIKNAIEVYKKTLTIKPNGKTKYILFSIDTGTGMYKHTPTEYSETHHDLYKSDAFSIAGINVKDTGPIE